MLGLLLFRQFGLLHDDRKHARPGLDRMDRGDDEREYHWMTLSQVPAAEVGMLVADLALTTEAIIVVFGTLYSNR